MTTSLVAVPDANTLPRNAVGKGAPAWWGMVLLCVTEAALFGYLLVGYFYLRGASTAMAAAGGRHPSLVLPALLTLFLVSSSVALRWGERGIERGDARRLMLALSITIALGVAFLVTQGIEYAREEHMPQTDAYWSTFFAITGIHGLHVFLGILLLTVTLVRTSLGHFTAERRLAVQNAALYWHLVDVIWLFILSALYLAPYVA